jgi:hypothetical protein
VATRAPALRQRLAPTDIGRPRARNAHKASGSEQTDYTKIHIATILID